MRRPLLCFVVLAMIAANAGARAGGVEPDEVRVVLYNDLGINGDMNEPLSPTDPPLVRTVKKYREHFAENTDTHGRTVHIFAFSSESRTTSGCSQRQLDAHLLAQAFDPFAVGFLAVMEPQCAAARLASKYGVLSFVLNEGLTKKLFTEHAPYVWGYFPDRALDARVSASFVCRSLARGVARRAFTEDPLLVGKPRTFAIVAERGDHRATLLARNLARCGIDVRPIRFGDGSRTITDQLLVSRDALMIMSDLKLRDVTTLICYCASSDTTLAAMRTAATAVGYAPEWYWDDATPLAVLERHRGRMLGLGVSHWWRQPAFEDRDPRGSVDFPVHTVLWMLFTAFHRAGPDLSVDTVDTGLSTLAHRPDDNPFVPGGGFDDDLSPQTYIDTALAWWHDPAGRTPGGRPGEGCFRVGDQGRRYTVGTWPQGDAWVGVPGAPCAELQPR